MKIRTYIFLAVGMLWAAGAAQAGPYDLDPKACPSLSLYIQTSNVTGNTGGSDACFGAFDGNDPGPGGDGVETGGMIFDFIAKADTVEQGGKDGSGGTYPADDVPKLSGTDIGLKVTFGDACTQTKGADDNGCWSFTGLPANYAGAFIIVIKAANSPGWAAYLFDTNSGSTSGKWQVAWNNSGACDFSVVPVEKSCAAISHLSIYAKRTTTVAEPATLGLLGLGLLGTGFARRRRVSTV